MRAVITGSGSYIPPFVQTNEDFALHTFYNEHQEALNTAPGEIIEKFKKITGIAERRYTIDELNTSDIGTLAASIALADSEVNAEEIDQIIVAHNFGNVIKHTVQTDAVPSLASRIKHQLGIKNPNCIPYDLLFGCPGWIQGLIHAHAFFKAGIASKALIIGTETLSRVIDMYDRDSMIFSDGAGAVVLESKQSADGDSGIISTASESYTGPELNYINMDASYNPESSPQVRYIKMKGRKVYEFAMKYVPDAMKKCLDGAGISIHDLKKIFIHQANEKMDDGIVKRFYELYNIHEVPPDIMPMSISWLGNSSVATIPTLYDLVIRRKIGSHALSKGDVIMFASVGAGMNVNAICYRC